MNAGAYRHYVPAQKSVRSPDGAAGYVESWADFEEVFVSITPLTGRERIQAGKITDEVTHRVRTRWRPDFPQKVRFVIGARLLTQVGPWIDVDERNEDIEMLCGETVVPDDEGDES